MFRLAVPLAVLGLLASLPARAEVYRCVEGGKTTYTDRPCAANAEPAQLPSVTAVTPGDHAKGLADQYDREAAREAGEQKRARIAEGERYDRQHAQDLAIRKALVEHRLIKGMTPADVRRVLHAPTRIENEGGVNERWIYEDGAEHRIVNFKDGRVSGGTTGKPRRH